ncbi:hypothetical protein L208DRAFT_1236492 [Tricholoma matsutake]|nr:hypothetical protein L208DRAFT_1236492 [Tricholoma matsutake 945]
MGTSHLVCVTTFQYNLSIEQVTCFIRLAAQLKHDIQLPLPPDQSELATVPNILPASVKQFLSKAIKIPLKYMDQLWDILKSDVWAANPLYFFEYDLALFKEYGWMHGLRKSQ